MRRYLSLTVPACRPAPRVSAGLLRTRRPAELFIQSPPSLLPSGRRKQLQSSTPPVIQPPTAGGPINPASMVLYSKGDSQ